MVRKTRGWGVNFWASENWSGRVHFEGHSPEWRVQPCLYVPISSSGQSYLLEMLYLPVEGTKFEGQYMKVKIS